MTLSAAVLTALCAAASGWVIGALCLGLWFGERGRRQAAERMLTFGSPDETGKPVVSRRPAQEAEDRFAEAAEQFSEEVIVAAVDDLKKQAQAQGLEGISEKQFRQDALLLLSGQDVMGPT